MQPVDLMAALVSDRGFSEPEAAALLDASPSLQFSICYGARLDCRAVCEVGQLLRLTSVAECLSDVFVNGGRIAARCVRCNTHRLAALGTVQCDYVIWFAVLMAGPGGA